MSFSQVYGGDSPEPSRGFSVAECHAGGMSKSRSRTLLAISIAAACAVVLLVALGLALNPTPEASPRAEPTTSPTATVPPSPEPSIIPASCADIYTTDWASQLAPYVLNPDWAAAEKNVGTGDVALKQLLGPNTRLTCQWGQESGAGDTGLVTTLAQIDSTTDSLVRSRLNTLGWTCYDSSGGVRCVTEGTDANGSWGESHFLRDGVWIATRWSNLAPDGYTADIVLTIWP